MIKKYISKRKAANVLKNCGYIFRYFDENKNATYMLLNNENELIGYIDREDYLNMKTRDIFIDESVDPGLCVIKQNE